MDRPNADSSDPDRTGDQLPQSLTDSSRVRSDTPGSGKRALAAGDHSQRPDLRLTLISEPNEVRRGLVTITAALARFGLSEDECERVEVVLGEIMNNIVEHAYAHRAPGYLSITINPAGGSIHVSVEDDGTPMPNQALPPGHPQDLGVGLHELPEGGFGWLLIRELSDNLAYERKNGRNLLTFSLPKSGQS